MAPSSSPLQAACASAVLSLVAGCGTATQPGPPDHRINLQQATAPSAARSAPACREGQDVRPGVGCVFVADGTPPTGTSWLAIPEGVVGNDDARRSVRSFWMDKRKVRVHEYRACVAAGACSPDRGGEGCAMGRQPADADIMTCATWEQAGEYCAWAKGRLPTDDEWDRAIQQHALFGLEELGGLAEWTSSYYCDGTISGCGHSRVVRGGYEVGTRYRLSPTDRSSSVGFRCVWSERPPPPGPEPPGLGPVTATTPGALACNTVTCNLATQACCLNLTDGLGFCVTRGEPCNAASFLASCDESADCQGNDVCCMRANDSSSLAPQQVCQPAPCDRGAEACLPGGKCAAGFRCETEWPGRHGRCRWQDVGARCGEKRCAGSTPVCCWDEQRDTGECSASACALDKRRYACASPRDCGGRACVAEVFGGLPGQDPDPGFECGAATDRVSAVLCDSLKDCPLRPTGERPKACGPTRELPNGVKRCVYVNEP